MKKVELTYPNSRFVITTIGEPVEIRKYAGGGMLKKIKKQTKEPPTQNLFFWSSIKLKGGRHVWFCLEIYSWYYSVPLLIVRVDYVRALCCHHYISDNVDVNINNLIEKWHTLAYMARWGCLLFCSLQGAHFLKWRDPGSRGLWRGLFPARVRGRLGAVLPMGVWVHWALPALQLRLHSNLLLLTAWLGEEPQAKSHPLFSRVLGCLQGIWQFLEKGVLVLGWDLCLFPTLKTEWIGGADTNFSYKPPMDASKLRYYMKTVLPGPGH